MSAFWAFEIWNTTITSDHDLAFRAVPPTLFIGMASGGAALIFGSRFWFQGRWRWAIAATIVGWLLVYVAMQVCFQLVPDAA